MRSRKWQCQDGEGQVRGHAKEVIPWVDDRQGLKRQTSTDQASSAGADEDVRVRHSHVRIYQVIGRSTHTAT